MRDSGVPRNLIIPWLVFASVLHAGFIATVRFDFGSPRFTERQILEVSLPVAAADATNPESVVLAGTRSADAATAPVANPRAASMPPTSVPASTPNMRLATSDPHAVTSTIASPHEPSGLAATSDPSIDAGLPGRTAPADPRRHDDTQAVLPANTAEEGYATRSEAGARVTQQRKPPSGTELSDAAATANEGPARVNVATLDRQISDWSAEYTQRSSTEHSLPPRTAYVEKVVSNRVAAAAYERDWQDKVERVGNMNYPEEARKKNLSGGLMLSVGVNADGTINGIHVRRSSGHDELDQAAMRIVRLASPFAVFPADLKKDYDVLWITRTWRFYVDNHLATTP